MPPRIPATFKATWLQCIEDKRRAIADAQRAKAAAQEAHQAAMAAKRQAAAAKKQAAAAKRAAPPVRVPGQNGWNRYLDETHGSPGGTKKKLTIAERRARLGFPLHKSRTG